MRGPSLQLFPDGLWVRDQVDGADSRGMARKKKSRGSITKPAYVVDLKGWPSPVASERRLDPSIFRNWKPECRGDVVETVADLFRYLRRAREYLVEADRQLRVEELTDDEHAAREAWYNDMDVSGSMPDKLGGYCIGAQALL